MDLPTNVVLAIDPRKVQELTSQGYTEAVLLDGRWCAIKRFNYTTALVVDINGCFYDRRYCFEHAADASKALNSWNGRGHPGDRWI